MFVSSSLNWYSVVLNFLQMKAKILKMRFFRLSSKLCSVTKKVDEKFVTSIEKKRIQSCIQLFHEFAISKLEPIFFTEKGYVFCIPFGSSWIV